MKPETPGQGTLFLIGGKAETCLLQFAQLVGSSRDPVVILPHASSIPLQAGEELQAQLRKAGVKRTVVLRPASGDLFPPKASAVYMLGGDQSRLVRLLGKRLKAQLKRFLDDGKLVAGSSAGAAAAVSTMIADGMNDGVLRAGELQLKPGLGLLPGAVVDTHFRQRGRFSRLMAAVTLLPGTIGVGLDEDTAIRVVGGRATVHGAGQAWFFVPGKTHHSDLRGPKDSLANVTGVELSGLTAGATFDLGARDRQTEAGTVEEEPVGGERFIPR